MSEYIDREAVLAEYDRQHEGPPGKAREIIAGFPAEDVRPAVHGKWVWKDYCFQCSACLCRLQAKPREIIEGYYDFCPRCGADMREAE